MGEETICGMLSQRVEKYGDRVMMKHVAGEAWKEISWNEFFDNVRRLGLALISSGVKPGDRVAIFSPNSPRWQMADMAILSVGAASVPLYATITAKQVEHILSDSGSKIVFVGGEDHMNRALEARDNLPGLEKIVTMDNTATGPDGVITFEDMIDLGSKNANPDEFPRRLGAIQPDDLCSVVYTSGTTGNPRGVMLSHKNFMSNVTAASSLSDADDTDVYLSFLPLSHVFERMSGYYTAIFNGVTIAHAKSIDTLANDIMDIRPHWMIGVPRLYEKIYAGIHASIESESPIKRKIFHRAVRVGRQVNQLTTSNRPVPLRLAFEHVVANKLVFSKILEKMGGRLRFCFSGGAPLAREIAEFFCAVGINVLEGYGLTETSPVLTMNLPGAMRFGSVGQALPNVEIRIADDGEILARGPNVMSGYWNNPGATASALEGGWFHTGDVGHLDKDGYLFITDRKKDLIVTAGGKNIAPQNIENALKLDRYIEQVAVIGDKRKFVSALIVPAFPELEEWAKREGIDASDSAALLADERAQKMYKLRIDEALSEFDRHERVTKFTLLPEEMTEAAGLMTPTLKVKRREVETRFASEIESMYESD
ncbi:MAG: long-chain fatty acid--CoA ligase [Candidatus Anoxymicrobium japonicum]|uniref:Acyl-CoA synthetase n=1 Tax=Candidatus Anoxymicrobium japonicum TaxID=2013648 RepID=A0A2N3G7U3_9ACTN|nr:MAG: long-chain fatty acid--CoA ligase [Candidatus Anoxymicrobium japonicum]